MPTYIENTTTQQASSNFNISNAGVIGTTLNVAGITTSTASGHGPTAAFQVVASTPAYGWNSSGESANGKIWDMVISSNIFKARVTNDANSTQSIWMQATRSGTTITDVSVGNTTDNPTFHLLGTGAVTIAGATSITSTTNSTSGSTGALVVSGGLGVAKDVYIGGSTGDAKLLANTSDTFILSNLNGAGQLAISATSDVSLSSSSGAASLSTATAEILVTGEIYVSGTKTTFDHPVKVAGGTTVTAGGATVITVGNGDYSAVCSGSGAPTLSAPKGSLYLRTDGSGTSNRAYINTNGSTTWTAITTAA